MKNYSRIVKLFNINCPSMNCPVKPNEICPLFDPNPCPYAYSKSGQGLNMQRCNTLFNDNNYSDKIINVHRSPEIK